MASLNNHPRVVTKIDLENQWLPQGRWFQSWWILHISDIAERPTTPNFSREWKPRFPTETQPEWMPQRMLTFRRSDFFDSGPTVGWEYPAWWTNSLGWKITVFHGKIHYFYGHVLCRKLLVYQRVVLGKHSKSMGNQWETIVARMRHEMGDHGSLREIHRTGTLD